MSKQNSTTYLIIKDSRCIKDEIDIVPDINSSLLVSVKEEIAKFGNDDNNQLYDTNEFVINYYICSN